MAKVTKNNQNIVLNNANKEKKTNIFVIFARVVIGDRSWSSEIDVMCGKMK